ncbi:MAG: MFS transporter [Gammaproteobacteria bacterium]|jgi:MFS family permease|nr:MFS transporter [Gammaproteobacteria bacterium]
MNAPLRWYLTGTALFLVPGGIQTVLFPWLVAVYLNETATRVGLAQMAAQLPMLVLILWGGWLGDRVDQRRLLITLTATLALLPLVIAVLYTAGHFSYFMLLCWALTGGTFAAFVQPARDALLNRVAGRDIQRVVTLTVGIQFGVQIIGFGLGSTADVIGPPILLCIMSLFLLASAAATARIPKQAPRPKQTRQNPLRAIAEGIKLAWQDEAIKPAIMQTFSVGIFFAGAYLVLLPLMVRDLYGGGSTAIAGAFAANMLGTVVTIFFLMQFGQITRPGRALIVGSAISALVLSVLNWELPLWLFYFVIFLWGACGGISMTMSRTIVQQAAIESHRARVMSVYSLGMMGGMPIGSFTLGLTADWIGLRNAVWVPVVGMLAILIYLRLRTKLWHVQSKL